jgi:DNA-binding winged helix-turn-helix (wHTH) protein
MPAAESRSEPAQQYRRDRLASTCEMTASHGLDRSEAEDFLSAVRGSIHAGHFFDSWEDRIEVARSFMKMGVGINDRLRCIYIHGDTDDHAKFRNLIRTDGNMDSLAVVSSSRLDGAGWGSNNLTEINRVARYLQDQQARANNDTYTGLRVVVDVNAALLSNAESDQIVAVREMIKALMATSSQPSVLYQYDCSRSEVAMLLHYISCHPYLVISRTLCRNPYYSRQTSEAVSRNGHTPGPGLDVILGKVLASERQSRWRSAVEFDAEVPGAGRTSAEVAQLSDIYEAVRSHRRRDYTRWQASRHGEIGSHVRRAERLALDLELQWLTDRASMWRRQELNSSGLVIDIDRRVIASGNRVAQLSRLEAALMDALLERAGQVCTTHQLLSVWGPKSRSGAQLRNYVVRLRRKLEMLDLRIAIRTVRGGGYCLVTDVGDGPFTSSHIEAI